MYVVLLAGLFVCMCAELSLYVGPYKDGEVNDM